MQVGNNIIVYSPNSEQIQNFQNIYLLAKTINKPQHPHLRPSISLKK